jgi:hypothetical protein
MRDSRSIDGRPVPVDVGSTDRPIDQSHEVGEPHKHFAPTEWEHDAGQVAGADQVSHGPRRDSKEGAGIADTDQA